METNPNALLWSARPALLCILRAMSEGHAVERALRRRFCCLRLQIEERVEDCFAERSGNGMHDAYRRNG
jgi:hypothetical protein